MRSNPLAHFPGNDGVQTDVVDYDESPGTPANRASGYQLELGCHRLFFATDRWRQCVPIIMDFPPFANNFRIDMTLDSTP